MQDEDDSPAGTSIDGVLGAVELDDDASGDCGAGGAGGGSSEETIGSAGGSAATIGGRRITFADGLAEAGAPGSSSGGGAAGGRKNSADALAGSGSWDGFMP